MKLLQVFDSQGMEDFIFKGEEKYNSLFILVLLEKVSAIDGNMLEIREFKIPVSRSKIGDVSDLILGGKLLG